MARIVCQVLHRSDRITFLWSEGAASFEPYHLEGAERAKLLEIAGPIHASLAAGDGGAIARLGHDLYRAILRLDVPDPGSAAAVQPWFVKLVDGNEIEKLEFLTDLPGLIPWNVMVHHLSPGDAAWGDFWGARFSIGAGRRVNALRSNSTQVSPTQLLAADLELVEQLGEAQKSRLNARREAGRLVHLASSLADEIKQHVPDVLLLLVRIEQGRLRLGADAFGLAELRTWLQEPTQGNPDPLVILMASGPPSEQSAWQALLNEVTASFSGVVANETLLPAAQAFDVGETLAQRFIQGQKNVGEILRDLRIEQRAAALAFSAFCPPQLRVLPEGTVDDTEPETRIEAVPLPAAPYRPFAAFEANDRALFFGREEDVIRGALLADHAGAVGVFLHGSPAAGKTSYLQAGLLPYLEQECVGYRVLRDRTPLDGPLAESDYPILILRATSDLIGQFADALSVFCAQPYTFTTPAGNQTTVDLPALLQHAVTGTKRSGATAITVEPGAAATDAEPLAPRDLWIALRDRKELLAQLLEALTRALPFELVIVIDQGEELLTLVQSAKQEERRRKAIEMLLELSNAAPRCKLVFTIRTQALGQFLALLPDGKAPAGWESFYLRPLSEAELVDALLWPTNRETVPYCGEIPAQKYGFSFEEGLAQTIVSQALDAAQSEQQSPLALLQATGALYDRQVRGKKQAILRTADVKEVGGVKDALTKYLDLSLERLPIAHTSRQALRALIGKLGIGNGDGTMSRDLISASDLPALMPRTGESAEKIVNQAAGQEGLFEIQELLIGGNQDAYISLPQDSLARLGKSIESERSLHAFGRTRIYDTLWIMIPAAFLCAAMSFWATRHYFPGGADEAALREKVVKEAQETLDRDVKVALANITRRPLYHGQLAQADQALRAGNALRTRQILLSQPAMRSYAGSNKDFKLSDLRGFEWRYLWKALNSERFLLEGHRGGVNALAVSPDGKYAASASLRTDAPDDAAIRIWSTQTGQELARIRGPKSGANALAFSPDGKRLAAAGADKLIRVWDVSQLKADFSEITAEPKVLTGHSGAVHALAFGKDANTLASGGADKTVILWDVASGKEKHALKDHAAAVHVLAFFNDGKALASAGAESAVILWEADTGKKTQTIKTAYRSIAALAASPDSKTLCTGGVEMKSAVDIGMVRFWNLADGKETDTAIAHGAAVHSVAFGSEGQSIVSGGSDRIARAWDVKSGRAIHQWLGHLGSITGVALTKDGQALVSGSLDGTVKIWNADQSSGPDVIAASADWVQCLALNPKNTLLASGARDGTVKLWSPATGAPLADLPKHEGAVAALAFSSHKNKTLLAVGTRDDKNAGAIKVWQIDTDAKGTVTAKPVQTFTEHKQGITCLAFYPGDDRPEVLISGSADATVRAWNADTGKLLQTYAGHKDEVRCVAFAADGRSFASGGKDRQVCLYQLDHKEHWSMPNLTLGSVESIALMPYALEGERAGETVNILLTGSADQTMSFWGFEKMEQGRVQNSNVRHFRTHAQPISAVSHNQLRGEHLIASASWDGTIKLFDFFSERFTLIGHQGPVRALVIAADQSFLASAGNDGALRIWRAHQDRPTMKIEEK